MKKNGREKEREGRGGKEDIKTVYCKAHFVKYKSPRREKSLTANM